MENKVKKCFFCDFLFCANIIIVDSCGQLENFTFYAKNKANSRKNKENRKNPLFNLIFHYSQFIKITINAKKLTL